MKPLVKSQIFLAVLLVAKWSALCSAQDNVGGNEQNELARSNSTRTTTTTATWGRLRTYGKDYRLTREEEVALDKFRPMVEHLLYLPWLHGDNLLIKFLRAKNLDLGAAAEMLKKAVEWRQTNKIDELAVEESEKWAKWEQLFPFIISGQDKESGPIYYISAAAYDVRTAVVAGEYETLERLYDRSFEKGVQVGLNIFESSGENVALAGSIIVDLAGFNLRQHACTRCLPLFVHVVRSYESYYPQMLRHIILLNAPRTIETIVELLRPFMSAHSRKVLEIHGVDKDEWMPILLSYIESDQLLIEYGGTRNLTSSPTDVTTARPIDL